MAWPQRCGLVVGYRMSFHLPRALDDTARSVGYLRTYYGIDNGRPFQGARFDNWDSTGGRDADADRFTADDIVAVSFLNVNVPALAAERLLVTEADRFSDLLSRLGPDRDLVDEPGPARNDWPGWELLGAIDLLHRVGPTIATKLLARKRTRLRPIYDSVVSAVVSSKTLWAPLQLALTEQDAALHRRLLDLQTRASLPEHVSALRVFDVVCWMGGKDLGLARSAVATDEPTPDPDDASEAPRA